MTRHAPLKLAALALVLGSAALHAADPVPAAAPAPTTAAPAPDGRHLHGKGVNLSPGVAELAKREGQVDLQKDERVKCEKYKPLGSNRWQYRCTTLAEDQLAREKNDHEMRKLQTPPPAAHGTLGR